MRLTELQPAWLLHEGQRVAMIFRCPHSFPSRRFWLTCFFVPAGTLPKAVMNPRGERQLFVDALGSIGVSEPENECVVGCNPNCSWTRAGDDFESISITPSLDASASGHWHGHITNGEIVGGL